MSNSREDGHHYRRRTARPQPGRPVPKNLGQRGPRDFTPAAEEEEDFRPPNPKSPVAGAKPGVVVGALLVLGGIVCLIVFPFLPVGFPGWTTAALIAAILLGLVVLFMQMPAKRAGSDDGARV
ncbi:hypothetical protein [Nesterenkonia sphaerica]|uniref:DUF308 domain-containing protein n=1 Tax=Nesterenkonia sphaerica TaxID=1804988 RepID=A0A5R9AFK8_9MICC|nr:hypothetical protein [Nesterenkonia sphaerica]TLP77393.1 hypothetical protein FEF27_04265 [Nesterenkonia sphaerica]